MITLITGTPGAGKTLWTVAELVKLYFGKLNIIQWLLKQIGQPPPPLAHRPLYVHGVPDLAIGVPYTQIYCRSTLCDVCQAQAAIDIPEPLFNQQGQHVNWREIEEAEARRDAVLYVEDWQNWAQVGSLIVLDEVQRIWRPRAAGTTVPPEISALETHRHKGLDFWLISQSGKLIDTNIRRLVGRHIHLVSTWKGRVQYEWSECQENTSSTSGAVSRPYYLPKSLFGKYRSASLHTRLDKRPPFAIYVVVIASLILAWIIYDIYKRYSAPATPATEQSAPADLPTPSNLNTTMQGVIPVSQVQAKASRFDFEPRVKGRAETAPAYDGLLKIQSVPFPQQCLAWTTETGKYCRCLTDQGTPYQMPYNTCIAYARGEVYNPYVRSEPKPAALPDKPEPFKPEPKPIQVATSHK